MSIGNAKRPRFLLVSRDRGRLGDVFQVEDRSYHGSSAQRHPRSTFGGGVDCDHILSTMKPFTKPVEAPFREKSRR
jgi:hypothetical protein